MKRTINHKHRCFAIWLIALLLFTMSGNVEARAGCREDGCYCSGTWSSSWQGTAQNGCIGTDCWYNPNTGNGCRGHVWYLYRTLQEASCTQDGKKEYLCSNCSAYIYKTINATGHDYSAWEKVDERTHKRICENCGDEQIESHTFGSWDIISPQEKNRTCSRCSFIEHWEDYTAPEVLEYSIWPSEWTSGSGRVTFRVSDAVSGISAVELRRTSLIDGSTRVVYETHGNPVTEPYSATYTENSEGMYSYSLYVKDLSGNDKLMYLGILKIDHTSPVLTLADTDPEWTNHTPSITADATDYLTGTVTTGSGVKKVVIKDSSGMAVSTSITSATFALTNAYEGIYSWSITAEDMVGHTVSRSITTKYDGTKPSITGTEITTVEIPEGEAGYCADNMIVQTVTDPLCSNGHTGSCLKSVLLYRVKNGTKEAVYSDTTRKVFDEPSFENTFEVSYDASADEADYYMITAQDFAGNISTKKLVSQRALLKSFHTSIERGSYR